MKKSYLVPLVFALLVGGPYISHAGDKPEKAAIDNTGDKTANPAEAYPGKNANPYTINPAILTDPAVTIGQNPTQSRPAGYGFLMMYNRYATTHQSKNLPENRNVTINLNVINWDSRGGLMCNFNPETLYINSFIQSNMGEVFNSHFHDYPVLNQLQLVTGWGTYATCSITPSKFEDIRVIRDYNEAFAYCAETNCDFMILNVRPSASSAEVGDSNLNYVGRFPRTPRR